MEKCRYKNDNVIHPEYTPVVLIIDDSKFMQGYFRSLLKGMGCQVVCASDGIEGVKLFQEHKPQIILVDAIMPIMDGFTTCTTIRNLEGGKNCLIIMVTTEKENPFIKKAFRVGVDDYFVKPINNSVFIAKIKKLYQEKCLSIFDTEAYTYSEELKKARLHQISLLPKKFRNQYISVDKIYSPYDKVSGDYIDYWWVEKEKRLYGYILDAIGHNISSAMQVCALRSLFCQAGRSGLSLSGVLNYINFDILKNHHSQIATAIMFAVDFKDKQIQYASAGISPFFLNYGDGYKTVITSGYPLGHTENADYQVEFVSFTSDLKEIIFASDGFSELITRKKEITCKHDDASAIIIKNLKTGGK